MSNEYRVNEKLTPGVLLLVSVSDDANFLFQGSHLAANRQCASIRHPLLFLVVWASSLAPFSEAASPSKGPSQENQGGVTPNSVSRIYRLNQYPSGPKQHGSELRHVDNRRQTGR